MKNGGRNTPAAIDIEGWRRLFLEIAVVETLESGTVTGFVLGHLVDGVMDGVVAELLGADGDGELAFAGSALGLHALLDIGLSVPDDLAEQFGDAGCVVGLLVGITLEGVGDFGIAFTFRLTAHGEVHSDLGTFSVEVVVKALEDFGVLDLAVTELVLACPVQAFVLDLDEFVGLGAAYGALLRRILALMDVSADHASEFLLHDNGCVLALVLINSKLFPKIFNNLRICNNKRQRPHLNVWPLRDVNQ